MSEADRPGSDQPGSDRRHAGRSGNDRPGTGRTIAVAAGSIAVITLLARVVGFGRWFAFSHSVGATCVGTVYQSVNAIPNALYEIAAGGVLAAVVIPLVSGALGRGDPAGADRIASALLTWAVAVLVPLGLLVVVFAGPIAGLLLAEDGCSAAVDLGAHLLRLFAIQIPLYGIGIVLAGILQSRGRFVAAALAPLFSSIVVIAAYLGYRALVPDPAAAIPTVPTAAVLVLGIGTTLGVVALSLPLLLPTTRSGVRLRPTFRFPESVSQQVRRLAVAGVTALAGQQLATLVVIRLANERGGAGTLNVFTYVQAVTLLPYAVLAVPLATAAFPTLAGQSAAEGAPAPGGAAGEAASGSAERTLRGAWVATIIAGLYGAGVLVAVAAPVGAFFTALDAGRDAASGAAALGAIPTTTALMAPGIVGLGVLGLLSRSLYVRGHARIAGTVVAGGWLLTLVVPMVVLSPGAGPAPTLRAIGMGSSLGLLAGAAGLTALAARSWGLRSLRVPARPLTGAVLGAVGAGATGWWVGQIWRPEGVVGAGVACVVAAVLGTAAFAILGTATDRTLVRWLLRRSPVAGTRAGR